MKKILPYERKVFYYETDKMGIVHHSNYIRIFEETRVSMLAQAGMPFEKIEAQGVLVPVLSVDCKYKYPLRFDEKFVVYSKITKFNGTSLEVEYKIISRDSGKICAEGHSSHCFTDEQLKPLRLRNKYPEIFNVFNDHLNVEITDPA